MTISLVIGKFWPPHSGHEAMIRKAEGLADTVYVVACATPTSRPTGRQRALWIQSMFPRAEVILTDDFCFWHAPQPCPPSCTPKWAERTRALIANKIDYFVASEPYGPEFATAIGATFVEFDTSRTAYPVSGTRIREDLPNQWMNLNPIVRAGLVRKVTIMGSESTGTTTLACDLAEAIGAEITPEVGRTVSWELFANAGSMETIDWDSRSFWRILADHAALEEQARMRRAGDPFGQHGAWVVSDTDALATLTWWARYVGTPPTDLYQFAYERLADAYVITSPADVGFVQDGIRDGEHLRELMHGQFVDFATQSGRPVHITSGSRAERLASTIDFLATVSNSQPLFER